MTFTLKEVTLTLKEVTLALKEVTLTLKEVTFTLKVLLKSRKDEKTVFFTANSKKVECKHLFCILFNGAAQIKEICRRKAGYENHHLQYFGLQLQGLDYFQVTSAVQY